MAAGECPSRDELQSILDAADPVREKQFAEHLESCQSCRTNLNLIAGADRLSPSSLQALSAPAESEGAALSKIVAQCERPVDAQETRYASLPNADALPFLLEPSDEPESIGRLGRFQVLRQLGRGGMGVVFLARDPMLGRQVAIKVLNPQFIGDKVAQERFLREARAAATINHRNLVTIYSVEQSDSNLLLIMEYVDGESLQDRLRAQGKIALPELLRVGIQVALGLSAAHAQGLVHRDIKPGNILIERASNQAKIADFGLAQIIDDPEANAAGLILGTPAYMAPEQATGHDVDNRADLFSLGSVLFAMVTGHPPYEGLAMNVLRQVAEGPPPSLAAIDPDVPAWLDDLVTHLHAFHREDRLTSATDVARILKAQLDALRHIGSSQSATSPATISAPATLGIPGTKSIETIRSPEQTVSAPPPPPFAPVRLTINQGPVGLAASPSVSTAAPPMPPRFTPGGAMGLSSPISSAAQYSDTPAQPIMAPPIQPPPLVDPVAEFTMQTIGGTSPAVRRRRKKSSVLYRVLGVIAALLALVAVAVGLKQNGILPASATPFMVYATDGSIRANCTDLAAAIEQAQSGDTLMIQGNDTFRPAPIQIHGKALTIKAGSQSCPHFIVAPAAATAWLETDAPLTLEGLDIVNIQPDAGMATASLTASLFEIRGSAFRAGCCRFVHDGANALLVAEGSPSIGLRHCLVVDRHAACLEAMGKKSGQNLQLSAENSIFAGKEFLVLHQSLGVAFMPKVHLRRDTIVVHDCLRLHGAPDKNKFDWKLDTHLNSQATIFDADAAMLVLQFDGILPDEAQRIGRLSRGESEATMPQAMRKFFANRVGAGLSGLKRTLSWQSDRDVRSGIAPLMAISSRESPAVMNTLGAPATWADWDKLWANPSRPPEQASNLIGGALLRKRVESDPLAIQAADFRHAAIHAPASAKTPTSGEGVAPERVGPGPAYEVWKLTPEYKTWVERDAKGK